MKAVTNVTNPVPRWWRPHKVVVRNGHLEASSEGSFYPLVDAVGGAFDMLADSSANKSDEEFVKFSVTFIETWGFLGLRYSPHGKVGRYPLMEFKYRRNRVLALAYLASAFRKNERLNIAINQFWQSDRALREFQEERDAEWEARMIEWGWPPKEPPYYIYGVSDEMRIRMEAEGISRKQLEHERWCHWPKPPSRGYVTHLLAEQLQVPSELKAVESNGKWELAEIPVQSVDHTILWTIRQRLDVIDYRICESCGHGFITRRSDQRFCTDGCGARIRMQKHRAKKSK